MKKISSKNILAKIFRKKPVKKLKKIPLKSGPKVNKKTKVKAVNKNHSSKKKN